jgi:hypothetical protein
LTRGELRTGPGFMDGEQALAGETGDAKAFRRHQSNRDSDLTLGPGTPPDPEGIKTWTLETSAGLEEAPPITALGAKPHPSSSPLVM